MSKAPMFRQPAPPATAEAWVDGQKSEALARLSIDLPVDLHRRFKIVCAGRGVKMSDEVRRCIEAWVAANG